MKLIMELMELALYDIVQIATVALELFGIAVLVFTAVKCFIRWLRKDHENIRLELAQGIALALEFKMAGEVLRTVVVREWSELGILGAIIVLRAMLTFLLLPFRSICSGLGKVARTEMTPVPASIVPLMASIFPLCAYVCPLLNCKSTSGISSRAFSSVPLWLTSESIWFSVMEK